MRIYLPTPPEPPDSGPGAPHVFFAVILWAILLFMLWEIVCS